MKKIITYLTLTIIVFSFYRFSISEEIPEREKFLTPEVETAIEKGLEYLAKHQKKNGSFLSGEEGQYYTAHQTGIQAICLLPFLANGHLPDLGKYGEVVKKGFNYLLDECRDKTTGMLGNTAYEHYFAVLALSQVFGEWKRDDLQEILEKATKLIIAAQNKNGGFGYSLSPVGDDETTGHCTAMEALRAAREAYIAVPEEVMKKAAKYTKSCFDKKDGGFFYRWMGGQRYPSPECHNSGWTRTGLCVVALMACGEYNTPETKKGLEWLVKNKPPNAPHMIAISYGAYYVAMALYQAGGEYWSKGYPPFQKWLLKCQKKDGLFKVISKGKNPAALVDALLPPLLDTAFAITALSFQKGLIPIFQR